MDEVPNTSPRIRLVAGLGNPGPEYDGTRHNIGFAVLDRLAADSGLAWSRSTAWGAWSAKLNDTRLVKPGTFMNRSGQPVRAVSDFYKIAPEEVLVVLDDFSLPLGRLRIRLEGSSGGHNGLESILEQFGTEAIPRLRVGIGTAPEEGARDYVLTPFFDEEKPLVDETVSRAGEAIKCAIDNGVLSAMNTFNKAI